MNFNFLKQIVERFKKEKEAKRSLLVKAASSSRSEETLSSDEWELIVAKSLNKTWKDEFALITGSLPYLLVFLGAVYYGFTGDYRMMQGTMAGIAALYAAGVDVGFIITMVLSAASGISIWNWFKR